MPYLASYVQEELNRRDREKLVFFGPLSETLGALYYKGYRLKVFPQLVPVDHSYVSVKVYLTDRVSRWKVGKTSVLTVLRGGQLSDAVKGEPQLLNVCSSVPKDPWATLMEKYPKPTKEVMVGNRTLREHVRDTLLGRE